VEFAPKSVD